MLYGSTRMDDHAIRDMQLEGLGNGKEQGIYNFSKKTTWKKKGEARVRGGWGMHLNEPNLYN